MTATQKTVAEMTDGIMEVGAVGVVIAALQAVGTSQGFPQMLVAAGAMLNCYGKTVQAAPDADIGTKQRRARQAVVDLSQNPGELTKAMQSMAGKD